MSQRLLLIGLDAAEHSLLLPWLDDGTLPHLARLRAGGSFRRLRSPADWLSGAAWATHHTGQWPHEHGQYHYIQWRAQTMAVERVTPEWADFEPFWRDIARQGKRVIAFDMPGTFHPGGRMNSSLQRDPLRSDEFIRYLIEISGWASHDLLEPYYAFPDQIHTWLRQQHGPPIRSDEYYGLLSPRRFARTRDDLIRSTERAAAVAVDLMQRQPWDLFLTTFAATHRGGHKLWDLSCLSGPVSDRQRVELADALKQVYIAADAAVGQLLDAAGPDAAVLVYAVHGMGPNTSYTEVLPQMLARVLGDNTPAPGGLARRLRERLPLAWRQRIKHALPFAWQDRLTAYWRMGRHNDLGDWNNTRALAVVADNQGYIRLNVRGREAGGVVAPGAEYHALCRLIADGLCTFTDAGSGEPVVEAVARARDVYPAGPRRHLLPDLIVRWAPLTAHRRRAVASPRFGVVPWPTPGQMPDGRSGNHRPEGFLLSPLLAAPVDGIAPATAIAATVYDLLDLPAPPHLAAPTLLLKEAPYGD